MGVESIGRHGTGISPSEHEEEGKEGKASKLRDRERAAKVLLHSDANDGDRLGQSEDTGGVVASGGC